MDAVRRVGGMKATIIRRTKRRAEIALCFNTQVSRKITQLGFRYARIKYEKNKLFIKFFQGKTENGKKLYRKKTNNNYIIEIPLDWQQVLENFPSMSLIVWPPLWQRIGEVSLRGDEAMVVFSSPSIKREELESFSLSEPENEECNFCFNLAYRFGFLYFKPKISKALFSQRVRGAKISKHGKLLIFQLKKDCYFKCKECPRLICQPFYYRRAKNYIQATISVYGFLKREGFSPDFLAKLDIAQRKGKVWMPNRELLIVELPFLAGH